MSNLDELCFALARNDLENSLTHGLAYVLKEDSDFRAKFLAVCGESEPSKASPETEKWLLGKDLRTDIFFKCDRTELAIEHKVTSLLSQSQIANYAKWLGKCSRRLILLSPFNDTLERQISGWPKTWQVKSVTYRDVVSILKADWCAPLVALFERAERELASVTVDEYWCWADDKAEPAAGERWKRTARYKLAAAHLLRRIQEDLGALVGAEARSDYSDGNASVTIPLAFPGTKRDALEVGVQIQGKAYRRFVRNERCKQHWERKPGKTAKGKEKLEMATLKPGAKKSPFVAAVHKWLGKQKSYASYDLKPNPSRAGFLYSRSELPCLKDVIKRVRSDLSLLGCREFDKLKSS